MAVFDTTFVIDVLHNDSKALALLDRFEETGEPQILPGPAAFEVAVELGRQRTGKARARRITLTLESIEIAPFTRDMAMEAGRIAGDLEDRGLRPDDVDCMIAGTAMVLEARLVTRNRKHFLGVRGLELVAY